MKPTTIGVWNEMFRVGIQQERQVIGLVRLILHAWQCDNSMIKTGKRMTAIWEALQGNVNE